MTLLVLVRSDSATLGRFTEESFQQLCFEFGIELDKDTENDPSRPKDQGPELAIEIPANRYDMLCFEGRIAHSVRDFQEWYTEWSRQESRCT